MTSDQNAKNNQRTYSASENASRLIEDGHAISPLITPADLDKLIKSGERFLLVDIRTESEFNAGHLSGASFLPRSFLEFAVRDGQLGADQDKIVLYCRSGNRSALAVKDLIELGFIDVCHLEGGFQAWFNAGLSFYNRHGEIKGLDFECGA